MRNVSLRPRLTYSIQPNSVSVGSEPCNVDVVCAGDRELGLDGSNIY